MRGKSHQYLGKYLAHRYFMQVPRRYRAVFILGCIQPDKNPLTYIKGSCEYGWLRGHNFYNARRFMRKLSLRLETRERWNLWDYYCLGKLIHYTADAFTQAHNEHFPMDLDTHRNYEAALQRRFLPYLASDPDVEIRLTGSIMEAIISYHAQYTSEAGNLNTDVRYALSACICIFTLLFTCRIV